MDVSIPTLAQVLAKVDAFLARHEMSESRLGRDSTGESSLITSMRAGRHPSLRTLNRLDDFMAKYNAGDDAAHAVGDIAESTAESSGKPADLTAAPIGSLFDGLDAPRAA